MTSLLPADLPAQSLANPGLARRLWRHRGARAGIVIMIALVLLAVIGPWFTQDPNLPDYANKLQPPGAGHLLGTDNAGRDLLARTLAGARVSLGAAALVTIIVTALGLAIGVLAGSAGGAIDAVLVRCMDVMLGLPGLVLTLAMVGVLGPGFINLILAMSVSGWAGLAKLARSYARGASRRPDIIAARMAGASHVQVAARHVVPGAVALVLVASTIRLGETIVALAGLSFLGLGAQPPTAEWGSMVSASRQSLASAPFQLIGPGIGLLMTVLAANLISEGLRDVNEAGARR